jgi:hypothetical protein
MVKDTCLFPQAAQSLLEVLEVVKHGDVKVVKDGDVYNNQKQVTQIINKNSAQKLKEQ